MFSIIDCMGFLLLSIVAYLIWRKLTAIHHLVSLIVIRQKHPTAVLSREEEYSSLRRVKNANS